MIRVLFAACIVALLPLSATAKDIPCRNWEKLFAAIRGAPDQERADAIAHCAKRTRWKEHGRYGFSPLTDAMANGDLVVLRAMLEAGVPVDLPDRMGTTIAHEIAVPTYPLSAEQRRSILSWYIQLGGDLNKVDRMNQTPVMSAVIFENTEVLKALLKAGADPHFVSKSGRNALFFAAYGGCAHKAGRVLLDAGVRLDGMPDLNQALSWDLLGLQCGKGAAERAFSKAAKATASPPAQGE
jgi:ankyrin repeat protein